MVNQHQLLFQMTTTSPSANTSSKVKKNVLSNELFFLKQGIILPTLGTQKTPQVTPT
jgi:hypothetical protein